MSVNENNSRFWHIDFLFEHLYNLYLTKIWILWVCIPIIIFYYFFFSGDRFWQLLLRTPTSLYLHSVPVLSSARSYFRGPIRNAHRYVEPWLHLGRTFDRVSFASRRRRRWPIVMYHWASWNASSEIVGPKQKGQKLYQLKR